MTVQFSVKSLFAFGSVVTDDFGPADLVNRRIRGPYVRRCERRTVGIIAHGRLLDYMQFFFINT